MDSTLGNIRDRIQGNTTDVTTGDLHHIISSEVEDINEQQKTYEKEHPEWREQKILTDKVENYFYNNPASQTLDVSVMPNSYETQRYKIGKERGVLSFTFDRSHMLSDQAIAHSFERSLDRLNAIQQSVSKITNQEPVTTNETEAVLTYLAQNFRRWEAKQQEAPTGSEEFIHAKNTMNIFASLFQRMRGSEGFDIVSEAEVMTRLAAADETTDKKDAFRRNFRSKPNKRNEMRMRPPTRKK
jgi:hypothetical protein